jgi:hypothetical protein
VIVQQFEGYKMDEELIEKSKSGVKFNKKSNSNNKTSRMRIKVEKERSHSRSQQ